MNAIFLNTCVYSKENLLEMVRKMRTLSFKLLYYATFFFLFAVFAIFLYDGQYIGSAIALALLALFILLYISLPHLDVYQIIQQYRIFSDTEKVFQLLFFDSYLVSLDEQTKKERQIDYGQIVRIYKTKHLYLLGLRESIVLLIDQNGFSRGNKDEFEIFIRQRAKNSKIRL